MTALLDVVAVNLETNAVRVLERDKTPPNAEAIVSMAVLRRGLDVEFFATAHAGQFKDGDQWKHEA